MMQSLAMFLCDTPPLRDAQYLHRKLAESSNKMKNKIVGRFFALYERASVNG